MTKKLSSTSAEPPPDRRAHWGWQPITGEAGMDWCLRGGMVVIRHHHRGEGYCLWQGLQQVVNSLDPLDLGDLIRMPCDVCGHVKHGAWEEAPFNLIEVLS